MDDLEQLLAKADVPTPRLREDLAGAVRQVVFRRRRRRHVVSLSAIGLLVGGIAVAVLMPRTRPTLGPTAIHQVDVQAYRNEIADLEADAKLHLRIAQAIENATVREGSAESSRLELSEPDVLMQVDLRRQVAAQLMLAHAEQLASDPVKNDEATANYKKLVALFPDTLASRAASDHLRTHGI